MQVCDGICDTLRPVAYQAIPLLVGIMGGGGDGARQAAARAISNLVCSDSTVQVGTHPLLRTILQCKLPQ